MAQIIGDILAKINKKFITYDIIVKFAQNSGGQIMHYYNTNSYISYKMTLVQM